MLWPKIISLLATTAPTAYFRKCDSAYWLGPECGLFSIDSGWLAFKFDTEDRVLATRVVSDKLVCACALALFFANATHTVC